MLEQPDDQYKRLWLDKAKQMNIQVLSDFALQ